MLSRRVARRRLEAGEQRSYSLRALQSSFRLVACAAAQLPTQLRATLELYFAASGRNHKPCSNEACLGLAVRRLGPLASPPRRCRILALSRKGRCHCDL